VDDYEKGEGTSTHGSAPMKLFQKGYKKNGKGIPNSISQSEGNETETNDVPIKSDSGFCSHKSDLCLITKNSRGRPRCQSKYHVEKSRNHWLKYSI
jgi:hypothetical protein